MTPPKSHKYVTGTPTAKNGLPMRLRKPCIVHYYVMNNSTAMNVTSLPGLMQYENTALNGLFGAGLLLSYISLFSSPVY